MMRSGIRVHCLIIILLLASTSFAQDIPLVYDVENTGADCPAPPLPSFLNLPVIEPLTDPFEWSDGSDLTYGRAAKREILGKFVSSILLGIGYLMVAFDNQKQGLHDKIADTYVIKL